MNKCDNASKMHGLMKSKIMICKDKEKYKMKDLGARAFSYGYASPVLMAATYNDDGTVNVMEPA